MHDHILEAARLFLLSQVLFNNNKRETPEWKCNHLHKCAKYRSADTLTFIPPHYDGTISSLGAELIFKGGKSHAACVIFFIIEMCSYFQLCHHNRRN